MPEVTETELPGVGIRYEFTTRTGETIGVVSHRSGRRELFVGDRSDPDAFRRVADLAEDDSRTLAELLGVSRIAQHLMGLQQSVEGLAIDWLPVDPDSPYARHTIGEARIRTRTGVSVVAVIRGGAPVPAPGPDFTLERGDYLVVVGTPRGIEAAVDLLHHG